MNVLVTGWAGYIGSHVIRALAAAGHDCVAYDNLSGGHRPAVGATPLIVADIADRDALADALKRHAIDAAIHLAAFIEAGESVAKPAKYYRNNTVGGLSVLEAMAEAGVRRMVFSSTAAVYGQPKNVPIREDDPTIPINPYGASKLAVELMLRSFAPACDMGFVALRYFNVAGADPAGDIGEDHRPETHLIPLILQVPLGRRDGVMIFGDDYDTPDGTCIRDYIHVADLARAHVLALAATEEAGVRTFNLGNGEGFSVRQVIDACRDVTGRDIPATVAPRRPGDPPRLVADAARAQDQLGWTTQYPDLKTIVAHAWAWHQAHPQGYDA